MNVIAFDFAAVAVVDLIAVVRLCLCLCLVQQFSIFVEFVGPPIHSITYFESNCRRTND